MAQLKLWMFVLILSMCMGLIDSQCNAPNCEVTDFLTPLDPDLVPDPDQTCYTENSTLIFTCPGIYGGPPGPFTCTGGLWGAPSPSCDAWTCDPPTPSSDVTVSPNKAVYNAGDTVGYTCPPGKVTTGTQTASCDESGWNPMTYPICQEPPCTTPDIPNGNMTTGGPYGDGDTFVAQCYPGYDFPSGSSSSISCNGGSWSSIPVCYGRCNIPAVANSRHSTAVEKKHGETLTILCTVGYSLDQNDDFAVSCDDGTTAPEMIPIQCFEDCVPLTAPTDGSVSGGYRHGQTASYSCNLGYELNVTDTETCNDGTWSAGGVTPTCHSLSLEDSISLECHPGYFVVAIPVALISEDAGVNSIDMGGCSGTDLVDGYILLNSTYTGCNTQLNLDQTKNELVYSNRVTNVDTGVVTTNRAIAVNIECVFDQNKFVSSSAVMQGTLEKNVNERGQYSLSFGAWADDGYVTPITAMDSVDTNSEVYLKAQVNNFQQLDVYPRTCYATPTSDPGDNLKYEIISNGVNVTTYAYGLSSASLNGKPTFSFRSKAFRFTGSEGQSVYFHCNLTICPIGQCWGATRRRRSIRDTQLMTKHVLAGPIKIRQTRDTEVVAMEPMTALTVYSATLSVLMVGTIVGVGVVIYRQHRIK